MRDPYYAAGLTRSEAAKQLGVSPHVVSMWALRGWLTPDGTRRQLTVVGIDRDGTRRFRRGDLIDADSDTAANRNSSRNPDRRARTEAAA